MKKLLMKTMVLVLAASLCGCAQKEEVTGYDTSKTLTCTVPFDAGSAIDIRARTVLKHLEESMGITVVIENKGGASGAIGAAEAAAKNSDGYELICTNSSVFTAVPLFNDVTFSREDFVPIASVDMEEYVLVACPEKSGIETVEDMQNLGRAVNFATGAPGSVGHISCETALTELGIDCNHVVVNGASAGIVECLGGHNDVVFAGVGLAKDYIEEGTLVPVVSYNAEDYTGFDGITVPTVITAGGKYTCEALTFFSARSDMDPTAMEELTAALNEVMADPAVQEELIGVGALRLESLTTDEMVTYLDGVEETLKECGPAIGLTLVG